MNTVEDITKEMIKYQQHKWATQKQNILINDNNFLLQEQSCLQQWNIDMLFLVERSSCLNEDWIQMELTKLDCTRKDMQYGDHLYKYAFCVYNYIQSICTRMNGTNKQKQCTASRKQFTFSHIMDICTSPASVKKKKT